MLYIIPVSVYVKAIQSCPALCDPMDCSPPGSSVHGILQARILEWVAIPFSRISSQPRDQTCVSSIGRQVLYHQHRLGSPYIIYEYTCIYSAIKKKEILPLGTTWMNLKGITLSEISQKEKDKHYMVSLICESKNVKFIEIGQNGGCLSGRLGVGRMGRCWSKSINFLL